MFPFNGQHFSIDMDFVQQYGFMMVNMLYQIGLWLMLVVSLPKLIYQLCVQGKYRRNFLARLGFGIPRSTSKGRPVVWIHAVSLGETRAVTALARRLKEELRNPYLVISSVTETGHAEAKRVMPFADRHLFLPFDLKSSVKRLFSWITPELVIITESDFWFNFLRTAKAHGAKIVVVNGKMSDVSARRFAWVPAFSRRLFGLFDLVCIQNADYEERFIRAGTPPERIHCTGNLKFDETPIYLSTNELSQWRTELGIDPSRPVVTVGSTHDPEEKEILQAFDQIWRVLPGCQLIMAPRHPERFSTVAALLDSRGISYRSYSKRREQVGRKQVVLIDAMGLLRCCYQLADVAVVAGSYTPKVGGHNILEPCLYGVPVIFGPHMRSQVELRKLVLQAGAGVEVAANHLGQQLLSLLQDPLRRAEIGRLGRDLMQTNAGATSRTWKLMLQHLPAVLRAPSA